MTRLALAAALLVCQSAWAAPESFVIQVSDPDPLVNSVGGSVSLEASVGRFDSKKYELRAYFPDDQTEVTSRLTRTDSATESRFRFVSGPLKAGDANSLHLVLQTKGSSALRELQELAAKFRAQIQTLLDRIEGRGQASCSAADKPVLVQLLKTIQSLLDQVEDKLGQNSVIAAESRYPLLVSNFTAAPSLNATLVSGLRVALSFDIGAAPEGGATQGRAKVTRSGDDHDGGSKQLFFRLFWNGSVAQEVGPISVAGGSSVSLHASTGTLSRAVGGLLELQMFESKKNKKDAELIFRHRLHEPIGVVVDRTAPILSIASPSEGQTLTFASFPALIAVSGSANEALSEASANGRALTLSADQKSFTGSVLATARGQQLLRFSAKDLAGNEAIRLVTVNLEGVTPPPAIPPAPELVAPPLSTDVPTTLASSVSFLYEGTNPIQTGVRPGAIDPGLVSVIRGTVLSRDSAPLSGVTVSVLGKPDLGQTISRVDGLFDIAVNGGAPVSLNYFKEGYLPSLRQIDAPTGDYAQAPEVILVQLDPVATRVELGPQSPQQVARGSVISDADGARQATVILPAGTEALAVLPNGETRPLSQATVRITEFTVGDSGPKSMPAPLALNTGYTYAAEFTVDEALVMGAKAVTFNQPVYVYVDNFLGFPVGSAVPAGYLDRDAGVWIASENGRVISVMGIQDGLAVLDTNGDGQADSPEQLSALGFSLSEQRRVADLYPSAKSLWRVPIKHFTGWDMNISWGPPKGAIAPTVAPTPQANKIGPCGEVLTGSIIECQSQVLREEIPLPGTKMSLFYSSARAQGYTADKALRIPLLGPNKPIDLAEIQLSVSLQGRTLRSSFIPFPNLETSFLWDGLDAYGRPVVGKQSATVSVSYLYPAVYYPAQSDLTNAFGQLGVSNGTNSFSFANSIPRSITLQVSWRSQIESPFSKRNADAGWTPSQHHYLDSDGVLFRGDGTKEDPSLLGPPMQTLFDGHLQFIAPFGLDIGPDGTVYFADSAHSRIYALSPDGSLSIAAGTGIRGFSGDGGPAIEAMVAVPADVAVSPDGSLLVADSGSGSIRRIRNGIISTVAGTGRPCPLFTDCVSDGVATAVQLQNPQNLAVASDGAFYFVDGTRVRFVGTDGRITTIAGGGRRVPGAPPPVCSEPVCGENGPARDSVFSTFLSGIALGPDNALYFSNFRQIFQIASDGILRRIAGDTVSPVDGEGVSALGVSMVANYLSVSKSGELYYSDRGRVRRITLDGVVNTVAGTGLEGFSSDNGFAGQTSLSSAVAARISRRGLILSDTNNGRIRRAVLKSEFFDTGTRRVPSADGSEVYVFSPEGRHLETQDVLTGNTLLNFAYSVGRLSSIIDAFGNTVQLQRDANGKVMSITGPFGHVTQLEVGQDGYLSRVLGPSGENYEMTYDRGLIKTFKNPRGFVSTLKYDAFGRLVEDDSPDGSKIRLVRRSLVGGQEVTKSSALNRVSFHGVTETSWGQTLQTEIYPDGTRRTIQQNPNGVQNYFEANGVVSSQTTSGDPLFGTSAPFPSQMSTRTPSGLSRNQASSRSIQTFPNGALQSRSETNTINGRSATRTFDRATLTWTATSFGGRESSLVLNPQGLVSRISPAGILPTDFAFDTRGHLISSTQGDRQTLFSYDLFGNLASTTNPLNQTTQYRYDLSGRMTKTILPDLREINYSYDLAGNLTSVTPPAKPQHLFTFTPVNLQSLYTAPDVGNGFNQTQDIYTLDRELFQVLNPGGVTVQYNREPASGRLSDITIPEGQIALGYHPTTGQLTSATATDGGVVQNQFDGDLLTTTTWTGTVQGSVTRTYDADFRMASIAVNSQPPISYQYDFDSLINHAGPLTVSRDPQSGLITSTSLGNVTSNISYNGFGEIIQNETRFNSTTLIRGVVVHRDKLGRVMDFVQTTAGGSDLFSRTYDVSGRLTDAFKNGILEAHYDYDANGNRLRAITDDGTFSGTYDAQDRILSYGNFTYTFDPMGQLKTKTDTTTNQVTQYNYDALGNLRSVLLPSGDFIEYVIDGFNRRIGKKVNGTLVQGFLYDDQLRVVAELDGLGNVKSQFVYVDRKNAPEFMIRNGNLFRFVLTENGNTRFVVNVANGGIAQQMNFDVFGIVTNDSNPGFQPFGFSSCLYDRATKLCRFGARDYDAFTGRWTAKDRIGFAGGDTNLYGYVLNDPINFTDPDGRNPVLMATLAILAEAFVGATEIGLNLCVLLPDRCRALVQPPGKFPAYPPFLPNSSSKPANPLAPYLEPPTCGP